MQRDFKGIWIPKEIWLSKELKTLEKVMLAEISSLDNIEGCFASNKYFAEFFDLSPNRVSEIITKLSEKKFITIRYEYDGKVIKRRVINVLEKSNTPIRNFDEGYSENRRGYSEKREDNNTINNTLDNIAAAKKSIEHFYNNNFAPITEFVQQDIVYFLEDGIDEALIMQFMKEAVMNKKNNWSYVRKCIMNKVKEGIKTLAQYEAHEAERERQKQDKPIFNKPKYDPTADWK